ncbi:MAG TPA: DinB family protein [Blastocatellia bacterium]|nr:DinB family protein [Blastocatellia bacterium]
MSCPETEHFIKNWNRIHKQTSIALAAAPDDQLDWQPKEGMFTMRQLLGHIPEAELFLVRTAMAGATHHVDLDVSGKSVKQILDLFETQHNDLVEEVSKLTLDQLNEEVEFYGRNMRRIVLLWGMTEHEIHHRGQLFTYYRLAGVEPPNIYG